MGSYLMLLGLTLLVEVPLAAWMGGRSRRSVVARTALWSNLLSHPLAYLLMLSAHAEFGAVEWVVAVVEVLAYRWAAGIGWGRSLAIGLSTNLATVLLALVWWS